MWRAMGLEFLKGDLAVGIRVHFFIGFIGLGGIFLCARAGFEFGEAYVPAFIGVEFLEYFFRIRAWAVASACGSFRGVLSE